MARTQFVEQLRALGIEPEDRGGGRLAFRFTIEVGRFAGREVWLGVAVGDDFPANPPGGPHVSPRLLPIQSGGTHPSGGVHDSPFGPEWQYWSRPFPGWAQTDRSVRAYLAHVRHLFHTQ